MATTNFFGGNTAQTLQRPARVSPTRGALAQQPLNQGSPITQISGRDDRPQFNRPSTFTGFDDRPQFNQPTQPQYGYQPADPAAGLNVFERQMPYSLSAQLFNMLGLRDPSRERGASAQPQQQFPTQFGSGVGYPYRGNPLDDSAFDMPGSVTVPSTGVVGGGLTPPPPPSASSFMQKGGPKNTAPRGGDVYDDLTARAKQAMDGGDRAESNRLIRTRNRIRRNAGDELRAGREAPNYGLGALYGARDRLRGSGQTNALTSLLETIANMEKGAARRR